MKKFIRNRNSILSSLFFLVYGVNALLIIYVLNMDSRCPDYLSFIEFVLICTMLFIQLLLFCSILFDILVLPNHDSFSSYIGLIYGLIVCVIAFLLSLFVLSTLSFSLNILTFVLSIPFHFCIGVMGYFVLLLIKFFKSLYLKYKQKK